DYCRHRTLQQGCVPERVRSATHCGRRVHREIEPEIFPAAPHVKVDSSREKHRGVALTSPTVQEFSDTPDAFWLHQRTWLDWRKLRSGQVRSGYHCGAWRRVETIAREACGHKPQPSETHSYRRWEEGRLVPSAEACGPKTVCASGSAGRICPGISEQSGQKRIASSCRDSDECATDELS